jgi:hypothetical protein
MLMHPIPRVRRIAENPDLEDSHPALALLLSNPWDGDESDAAVKAMAAEVAIELGVASLIATITDVSDDALQEMT